MALQPAITAIKFEICLFDFITQSSALVTGKCPYVTCDVGDWNPWKGALPIDGCTQQIRTKNVTERKHAKMQFDDCGGLQTTCPPIPPDLRQWCK